jgi:ABC-2 type transport system permease protein
MSDILTVMRKERLMLFRYRGGRMRFVLTLLSPLLLAFYVSWSSGIRWVEQPVPVFPCALVAVLAVIIVVPETFAGERERHTLETLLATRLGDASILFGKLGLAVAFSMILVVVVLALGLITANIFHWGGEPLLYTAQSLTVTLTVSLLLSVLVAAVGVIISLGSETVQEATQTLAGVVLVPPIILGMLVLIFRRKFVYMLMLAAGPVSGLVVLLTFILIDLLLLAELRRRFRRSRLLLD